ncbi:MAG: lipoprotein-releasing ABC transporter permease subunit [Woeseiaceae bacterium]|nr:lipoprotein-releasing ABC transporter permease subunit [Woeseiaceae bacterium]
MFELWVGNRYVRSRSANSFVSLISAISTLGIAIAVLVLIVVLSVVNGFERELRDRLLAMVSHAAIEGVEGSLDNWQDLAAFAETQDTVVAAAPYLSGQSLLVFGENLSGAELRGVEPVAESRVSGIADVMLHGEFASLEAGRFNIILGVELANELGVGVGDKVTVNLAEGMVTPLGVEPRKKQFTVSGLYRVGMWEFDRRLAFIHLEDAQRLYRRKGSVTGVRLAVSDIFLARDIVRDVAMAYGQYVMVTDWRRGNENFFRSIQITKSILFVILLLVIAVAAFNIVSTLVMVVKDKQSDIAILRTVGARPSSIVWIFVAQGTLIGAVGTLLGVAGGILVAANLEAIVGFVESAFGIKLLAADVYFISDLPSDVQQSDVVMIGSIAFLLALVSTLYPAWMAARTAPAEALRYE